MTYPNIDLVIHGMIKHDAGNPKLIQHFLKVHEFARLIGIGEGLEKLVQFTLETAAVVHDIGILTAKRKHGSSAGKYQELEGPAEAKSLLSGLGWPQEVIDRVCYLVGRHHTYTNIDGPDIQILAEAVFWLICWKVILPFRHRKTLTTTFLRLKPAEGFAGCFTPSYNRRHDFFGNKKRLIFRPFFILFFIAWYGTAGFLRQPSPQHKLPSLHQMQASWFQSQKCR